MSDDTITLTKHKLELARELIDDLELSRLAPEQLLLKSYRLARLSDNFEMRSWLYYELSGYPGTEEGKKYMDKAWRWTDKNKGFGWWIPFASISSSIANMQIQIQQLKVPDVHLSISSANPNEFVTSFGASNISGPAMAVLSKLQELTLSISTLSSIKSRVLMSMHAFATDIYYELAFSGAAESIFQRHKGNIDLLLREAAADVLEKVPSIYDRLASGDNEAISQAMNSCRRIIKAFADAIYPPKEELVTREGKEYHIGTEKTLNRIELFIRDHLTSASRIERLNKTIRLVYDRVAAGSHNEVTPEEARSLFLQTYLVLGEILEATKVRETAVSQAGKSA